MTAEQLLQEQINIHSEIDIVYQELVEKGIYDSNKVAPIKDGVTDIAGYLDPVNAPRIMWLLKEPWDKVIDGEPYGGGFDMTEVQKDLSFINNISYSQKRIIYSMQCIRTHGNEMYNDMSWYYEMPQHLTNIAYVNLSKMPGYPTTDSLLTERAIPWKEIVKKQIALYEPDIIISANIIQTIKELGFFSNLEFKDNEQGLVDVYITENGKLLFDVYHPSYFAVKTNSYIKSLADAINKHYFNCPLLATRIPYYPIPEGFENSFQYLKHKVGGVGIGPREFHERISYELEVIKSNEGVANYLLVMSDLVRAARKQFGIYVGPGRGSVTCSLVCYKLGITQINPLEHDLPFDCFVCPDRNGLPEIDIEIESGSKHILIEYLKEKYGQAFEADRLLEATGSIKINLQELESLRQIHKICNLVEAKGCYFDINNVPLNDQSTLEAFANAETMGIIGFDSEIMKASLRCNSNPTFKNLVALKSKCCSDHELSKSQTHELCNVFIAYQMMYLKVHYPNEFFKVIGKDF